MVPDPQSCRLLTFNPSVCVSTGRPAAVMSTLRACVRSTLPSPTPPDGATSPRSTAPCSWASVRYARMALYGCTSPKLSTLTPSSHSCCSGVCMAGERFRGSGHDSQGICGQGDGSHRPTGVSQRGMFLTGPQVRLREGNGPHGPAGAPFSGSWLRDWRSPSLTGCICTMHGRPRSLGEGSPMVVALALAPLDHHCPLPHPVCANPDAGWPR